jgi:hypothetical protein
MEECLFESISSGYMEGEAEGVNGGRAEQPIERRGLMDEWSGRWRRIWQWNCILYKEQKYRGDPLVPATIEIVFKSRLALRPCPPP